MLVNVNPYPNLYSLTTTKFFRIFEDYYPKNIIFSTS